MPAHDLICILPVSLLSVVVTTDKRTRETVRVGVGTRMRMGMGMRVVTVVMAVAVVMRLHASFILLALRLRRMCSTRSSVAVRWNVGTRNRGGEGQGAGTRKGQDGDCANCRVGVLRQRQSERLSDVGCVFDCRRRRRNDLFGREDMEGEEECARDTEPRLSMSVWVAWRWATR